MHLAIFALVAVVCALSASALPAPPNMWYVTPSGEPDSDPTRRRDSPLHNLPNDGGFVETGRPGRREMAEVVWRVSSNGNDNDPVRRRDSPLHNLPGVPDEGIVQIERPDPRIKDSNAWFVNFWLSPSVHC
ncbi:MAG: hypothetical protein ASARMPREDX12_001457 [Alectoria sarmentosa]|nr:MAG: hypothetical protein ASARMPREDX12_001457 [Alectoria sarmentosa]